MNAYSQKISTAYMMMIIAISITIIIMTIFIIHSVLMILNNHYQGKTYDDMNKNDKEILQLFLMFIVFILLISILYSWKTIFFISVLNGSILYYIKINATKDWCEENLKKSWMLSDLTVAFIKLISLLSILVPIFFIVTVVVLSVINALR